MERVLPADRSVMNCSVVNGARAKATLMHVCKRRKKKGMTDGRCLAS